MAGPFRSQNGGIFPQPPAPAAPGSPGLAAGPQLNANQLLGSNDQVQGINSIRQAMGGQQLPQSGYSPFMVNHNQPNPSDGDLQKAADAQRAKLEALGIKFE